MELIVLNKKRIIATSLVCVSILGLLSGCSKKMDYDTQKLEGYFDEASEYSNMYKTKLENAVNGQLDEMIDGAQDMTYMNTEEGEKVKEVVSDDGITRKEVKGGIPDLIVAEKDIDKSVKTKTETSKFLNEEFEVTSYRGMYTGFRKSGAGYVAWKYKKDFEGTMSNVYNELQKITSKIDDYYKNARYFDESFRMTTTRGFKDMNKYSALYKADNGRIYVKLFCHTEQAGPNDVNRNKGYICIWFFDTEKEHNIWNDDFGDETPMKLYENMMNNDLIPSDFNLKMYIRDDNGSFRYLDHNYRYGYGKATSPKYNGVFDLITLAPGETADPEPTPEPEPEIIDELIIDDGVDIEGEESMEDIDDTENDESPEESIEQTSQDEPIDITDETIIE